MPSKNSVEVKSTEGKQDKHPSPIHDHEFGEERVTSTNPRIAKSACNHDEENKANFKERKKVINFPWKWDLPSEIPSPPLQRRSMESQEKSAETTNTEDLNGSLWKRDSSTKELDELNAHISWIYEDSSDSDSDCTKSTIQQNRTSENISGQKENVLFDVKFRDHLMKELLKQGKDVKWYLAGAKKARENLEKGENVNVPGLQIAAKVSKELNQFLMASMRPYHREKKVKK